MLRAIKPLPPTSLRGVAFNDDVGEPPELRWVDPSTLLVDETYQRGLSERSISLIRRIVAEFDWASFKAPVVIETDEGLKVTDGQHSAISAATHPNVDLIPVLVNRAKAVTGQARSFLNQNVNRLNVTRTQLHHSSLAAGQQFKGEIVQESAWVVVFTKSSAEEVAEKSIREAGFRVYLPREKRLLTGHRAGAKGEAVLRPYFPRYLFVELHQDQVWSPIKNSRGVSDVVRPDGIRPGLIAGDAVEAIRLAERQRIFDFDHRGVGLDVGDTVKILDGPWKDFIAELTAVDEKGRIWVLMSMFGRQAPARMEAHQVVKMAGATG